MHHEMERLVDLYDRGGLSRRRLLQGLLALSVGPQVATLSPVSLRSQGRRRRCFTRAP